MELNTLLSWLKTPAGKAAIEREEGAEVTAKRRQWADAIRAAEAEYGRVSPPLVVAEKAAADELERVKKKAAEMVKEAEQVYLEAKRARNAAGEERDRVMKPAVVSLRETCSPRIAEFALELERRRRSPEPECEQEHGYTVRSTERSIQAAANRINQIVVHELRKLEIEPLTGQELESKLQELEASIPEIEMEKII